MNSDNNDPHLIQVYQSFNNTRYHSLVKINDKTSTRSPTPKREIYGTETNNNNNIQNNTNQIPFILQGNACITLWSYIVFIYNH